VKFRRASRRNPVEALFFPRATLLSAWGAPFGVATRRISIINHAPSKVAVR